MKQTHSFVPTNLAAWHCLPETTGPGKAEGTGLLATGAQGDGIIECVPAPDTAPGITDTGHYLIGAQDGTGKIMGEKGRTSRGEHSCQGSSAGPEPIPGVSFPTCSVILAVGWHCPDPWAMEKSPVLMAKPGRSPHFFSPWSQPSPRPAPPQLPFPQCPAPCYPHTAGAFTPLCSRLSLRYAPGCPQSPAAPLVSLSLQMLPPSLVRPPRCSPSSPLLLPATLCSPPLSAAAPRSDLQMPP